MNGQGAASGRPFVAKLCTRLRYRHREGRGVRLTPLPFKANQDPATSGI